MTKVEGISFTLIMTKLRVWTTAFIGAILSVSVLVGAGPVQAGEVCPNNLKLPTPKSLGLGSGWVGVAAFDKNLKSKRPENCRYATQCVFVVWTSQRKADDGAMLTVGAYEIGKKDGKQFASDVARQMKRTKGIKHKVRRRKTVTFGVKEFDGPVTASSSISFYNNQRIASVSLMSNGSFGNRYQKRLSLKKLMKKTEQMTNPCSGKMSKFPELQPLKKVRQLSVPRLGAWSLIR